VGRDDAQLRWCGDVSHGTKVARVLAVHIGHYQRRYGRVPMEETLARLHTEAPTDEQIADLAEGMQTLVAVLMLATGVADDQAGKA
jgi:hypothetical protein